MCAFVWQEYYAPGFVRDTNDMSPLEPHSEETAAAAAAAAAVPESFSELSRAPEIENIKPDLCADIMKCLNMLGVCLCVCVYDYCDVVYVFVFVCVYICVCL